MPRLEKGSEEAKAWAVKMKKARDLKKKICGSGVETEKVEMKSEEGRMKHKTGAKITMDAKKHMDMMKPLDLNKMPKSIKKASKELLDKVTTKKKPKMIGGFLQPGEIPIQTLGKVTDETIFKQDEENDVIEGGKLVRISEDYPIFILKA